MLTETQMADRLALIKQAAEKRKRLAKKSRAVKGWMNEWMREREKSAKAPTQNLTEKYDSDNINHYTDANQYAKQYYGERYSQTTRWDNDWGDD